MYAKLIFRNAKRSAKDYLIYIMTLTVCVTLFYSFLSVSSRYYHPNIGSEYDFTLLSDGMKAAVFMITLCLLFLIRFVNNYMLQSKQKEFAVQSVMGMEQKIIGRLFFAETFLMGLFAIGIGIFLGVFCSQFITAMLLKTYGKSYKFSWTLFPDTVLLTICFFIFSFLIVGIWNARTIAKMKIIDMLLADRENEPELRKGRWMYGISIIFEIFLLFMLTVGIQKMYFYYDSRFAFPVLLMFLGNMLMPLFTILWSAVWIVRRKKVSFYTFVSGMLICSVVNAFFAASVPVLMNKYYLPLGGGTVNQYLLFLLIDLIFFICAVVYLASFLLAVWKEKSLEYKYCNENLFFFGQIISKLNTTSKTMTLTSITLVLAIFLFISAPVLVSWASGYLDTRAMYDIQISSEYNNVYKEENLSKDNYETVTKILESEGIKTDYDCVFSLYLPQKEGFHNRMKYDFPVAAISLSDYNAVRSMLGFEEISLEENEFTTQWKAIATKEEREEFLKQHENIATDAGSLQIAKQPYYEENMGETMYNSYTNAVFVFSDKICEELLPVIQNRYIITEKNLSYEEARKVEKEFVALYPEETENGVSYFIRLSTLQINSTIANNFVLQAAMTYGAIVLIVICLTVLSLQQLFDAGHYRYRFSVLRKLGVEEDRIEKLMLKQLGVWFGLPVFVAIFVSVIAVAYFLSSISAEISAYIGLSSLLLQVGITVGILALLLLCYFISTWIIFRRSIIE